MSSIEDSIVWTSKPVCTRMLLCGMIRWHHFHDKIGDLIHILLSGHFETGFSSTTSTSPKLPAQLHLLQMWAQQDLCLQAEIVGQVMNLLCMLCQQYEPCISLDLSIHRSRSVTAMVCTLNWKNIGGRWTSSSPEKIMRLQATTTFTNLGESAEN